jgi:transposase
MMLALARWQLFARTKLVKRDGKTYEYVQIVESTRINGATRQRVVRSLGARKNLKPGEVERLIASLRRVTGFAEPPRANVAPELDGGPITDILDGRRFGDVFVLRRIWEELGLKAIFNELACERGFKFSRPNAIFTMVANRAIDPRSKLDGIEWANRDVLLPEVDGLNEDHMYRTLTWLDHVKERAETAIYERVTKARSKELQLVLYDTSTLHFETEAGPPLAEHGRPSRAPSKKKIVLVALVTTFDGWPIYHHVFPGSTTDTKTVEPILKSLKNQFKVGRVIVLADNGMICKRTLTALDNLGFDYIAAVKPRGTTEVRDRVLGRAGRYRLVDPNLRVKEVTIDERRYVVCHNPEEEARDKARRGSILSKLREELQGGVAWDSAQGAKIRSNAAYKRYVARGRGEHKGQIVLSEAKIAKDARYDGKWVVHTSRKDLSPEDVACLFKCQGDIEREWRDLKSYLGLRPVFHRTDRNVRGHVFICVLAKLLLRELQRRMDTKFAPTGCPATVIENLGRIPVVLIETEQGRLWVRKRLTPADEALLRVLDIDPAALPKILPSDANTSPPRDEGDHP